MQRGGVKHKRSKLSGKPGSVKQGGSHTVAKAEQPKDRPMLGVQYQAPALKDKRAMLCHASMVPQRAMYTSSVPSKPSILTEDHLFNTQSNYRGLIAGDDDDFGDVPMSPSTDEDEGPLVALPDEDPFAAAPEEESGAKPKAKKQKKRKAEASATTADVNVEGVSRPACLHILDRLPLQAVAAMCLHYA